MTVVCYYFMHSGEARGFGVGGCSGDLGRSPQRVPGQSPWSEGQRRSPLKLKSFEPSEERGSWQICHPVKHCVNCSNILLEKVFVSPLPSASPFLSWFTSSSTSQLISVIIPTLVIHTPSFFHPRLKIPFNKIPSHRRFLLPMLDCLTITGLDRT